MSTSSASSASASLDRPIFVVGHPRSGTTLLATMLGRHPSIASTPETLFMTEGQYQLHPAFPHGAAAVAKAAQSTRLRHMPMTEEALAGALAGVGRLDARAVFTAVLEAFRRKQGKDRILEKSPVHMRHIDELLAWYPDARILWIVRDGRACVSSLMKVDWASTDLSVLGRQWVRNMAFALDSESRAGPALMRVSYEALVADPAAEMIAIQNFVGVDASQSVHDHTVTVETVSSFERSWKGNVDKPVAGTRSEAWRAELSEDAQRILGVIMDPMLERLGYATGPAHPTMSVPLARERLQAILLYNPVAIALLRRGYRYKMLRDASRRPQADVNPVS